MSNLLPQLKS